MNYLDDILKLEFTPKNQLMVSIMLGNFLFNIRDKGDSKIYNVLHNTMLDIDANGINPYHYDVIAIVEECICNSVLA